MITRVSGPRVEPCAACGTKTRWVVGKKRLPMCGACMDRAEADPVMMRQRIQLRRALLNRWP